LRGPCAGRYKAVESTSAGTLLASGEQMLGGTLLGARVRDLRSVLKYLRTRVDVDGAKVMLWGDSFAPVNGPDDDVEVPWGSKRMPHRSEPMGALAVLYAALFEPQVKAIYARGGLVTWESVLESAFVWLPADVAAPGLAPAGEFFDVVHFLAPRPVRQDGLVDGRNRRVPVDRARHFHSAAWVTPELDPRVEFGREGNPTAAADWLLRWK
jgi:hypothetical protein